MKCRFLLYLNRHWHYNAIFSENTWHTLKNGAVSKVNNKCISPFVICRLGDMWRGLSLGEKNIDYEKARKGEAEHQAKYPGK
jgi:hypothetical protein